MNIANKRVIIFLGGYAESGKTEFIKIARANNYLCFSSSELLHEVYKKIFLRFNGFPIITTDKTRNIFTYTMANSVKELISLRTDLIFLAEQILTKVFSRSIFASAIMEKMLNIDLTKNQISIIETIGGEEYEKFIFLCRLYYPDAKILNLNIRRDLESQGIDSRKLLPDADVIYNNGTKAEYEKQILIYLKNVLNC